MLLGWDVRVGEEDSGNKIPIHDANIVSNKETAVTTARLLRKGPMTTPEYGQRTGMKSMETRSCKSMDGYRRDLMGTVSSVSEHRCQTYALAYYCWRLRRCFRKSKRQFVNSADLTLSQLSYVD